MSGQVGTDIVTLNRAFKVTEGDSPSLICISVFRDAHESDSKPGGSQMAFERLFTLPPAGLTLRCLALQQAGEVGQTNPSAGRRPLLLSVPPVKISLVRGTGRGWWGGVEEENRGGNERERRKGGKGKRGHR